MLLVLLQVVQIYVKSICIDTYKDGYFKLNAMHILATYHVNCLTHIGCFGAMSSFKNPAMCFAPCWLPKSPKVHMKSTMDPCTA